jgi:hypothetical protein
VAGVQTKLRGSQKEDCKLLAEDNLEQLEVKDESPVCPTCKQPSQGKFCSACGEEVVLRPDYSFRRFLSETLNIATSLESNIFRSFALLISKPGFLTVEYFAGRRKRYLKPLQLFIFCNVIFFFFQAFTGFNSLRTPLQVHLHQMPYSSLARRKVAKAIVQSGTTFSDYEARFNSTLETQAKTLVFLMIPMFALGLEIIYLRKGEFFVKHLVFSTHFFAFYLLMLSILYLVIKVVGRVLAHLEGWGDHFGDLFMTAIMLSCCLVYLVIGCRRAYEQSWALSVLKGLALIGVLAVVVQSFRLVLFFTAFYSI